MKENSSKPSRPQGFAGKRGPEENSEVHTYMIGEALWLLDAQQVWSASRAPAAAHAPHCTLTAAQPVPLAAAAHPSRTPFAAAYAACPAVPSSEATDENSKARPTGCRVHADEMCASALVFGAHTCQRHQVC